jgi:hypothetical protein
VAVSVDVTAGVEVAVLLSVGVAIAVAVRWKLGVDVYRWPTQRRPGVEYVPVTPNSGRRNRAGN